MMSFVFKQFCILREPAELFAGEQSSSELGFFNLRSPQTTKREISAYKLLEPTGHINAVDERSLFTENGANKVLSLKYSSV